MPKLIIVEGIDSTGKTSLTHAIQHQQSKEVNWTPVVFHCTASPDLFQGLIDYHLNVAKFCKTNMEAGHDIVLDRFWPSEVAYGQIFRPLNRYQNEFRKVILEIEKLQPTYVFCHSEKAWERYKAEDKFDPAHRLDEENFHRIEGNYRRIFSILNARIEPYCIEENGSSIELDKFIKRLWL